MVPSDAPFSLALQQPYFQPAVLSKCGMSPPSAGDAIRATVARTAIVELLLQDERLQCLWREWNTTTGASLQYTKTLRVLRDMAQVGAFERPIDVASSMLAPGAAIRVTAETAEAVRSLADECFVALENLLNLARGGVRLIDSAKSFVTGLGLSYEWLAWEIVRSYHIRLALALEQNSDSVELPLKPTLPSLIGTPTPLDCSSVFHIDFQNYKDVQSAAAALESAYSEAKQVLAQAAAAGALPMGRLPRERISNVFLEARWFYRFTACDESIRSIALSIAGRDEDKRAVVRAGIERTRQLLSY
jgi:hypothetical protein